MSFLPRSPAAFAAKKAKILKGLEMPEEEYTDLSPKGSVDIGIQPLIRTINCVDGLVTTSSCAGRVSVFVEGRKKKSAHAPQEGDAQDMVATGLELETLAAVGGKGGGGTWLFVSHDPVQRGNGDWRSILGLQGPEAGVTSPATGSERLVHFKFEPMILHILTASPAHAQLVLRCALQAGFRESGSLNITPDTSSGHTTPMVAVRSLGLSFESLLGHRRDGDSETTLYVPEGYLDIVMDLANERFIQNTRRIERFREAFEEAFSGPGLPRKKKGQDGEVWEDAEARRTRKREEGLRRQEEARKAAISKEKEANDQSEGELSLEQELSVV
ncbi:hypothetical protein BROUX41_000945 [Berkeleyomyces rouxiae]|uniref:uncharacterized protein n=1 Tax=Berkeleyomyces rouxiae TaxID=2035830 RepID=UPI003B82433D